MLRIVLVLQVLILLLFGFFILNIQNTVNELSGQLETALLTIEDMKTVLPEIEEAVENFNKLEPCLLYTSPSPRDLSTSRMPSSA